MIGYTLDNLKYFFLAYNKNLTSQTIPTSFGQLKLLQDMSLQSNYRIGIIQTELVQLSNLVLMDLADNKIDGTFIR